MTNTLAWTEFEEAIRGQRRAALPDASAWVAANAGSGKTKVLIDRVARLLLLENVRPDEILCVTYTKAAASEMQARLFQRLGEWCVMDADRLRAALSRLEDKPESSYRLEDIGRARELFAQALETPGGLRIETLHAFCGRILKRFPLEAGIAPGFRELDEPQAMRLWNRSFENLGAIISRGDSRLREAARIAGEAAGGRGVAVVLQDLNARRSEFEDFIRDAGDLESAIEQLRLDLNAPEETSDAICSRAVNADLPRETLQQTLDALREAGHAGSEASTLIEEVLSSASDKDRFADYCGVFQTRQGDQRKRNFYKKEQLARAPALEALFQIAPTFSGRECLRMRHAKAAFDIRTTFERSAALVRLAHAVFEDFAHRKRSGAGLDFEDLIRTVRHLLTERGASEWVLWKLDGGLRHILLDEAQDTSPSQWAIIRALTANFFVGSGIERAHPSTLFVVGDQKQSIYSFQGADPERFIAERQDFQLRASASRTRFEDPRLDMSFRSARSVLGFVDETFDPAAFNGAAPFSISTAQLSDPWRHTAYRREHEGSVEIWPLTQRDQVAEREPWDAPLGQESAASPKQKLARAIAEYIRKELEDGAGIWDGETLRPARPGDFLILVRGRKGGLFDAILQALKKSGLPVAGADRLELLESLPVQDLLNLVRFALCPEDDLTLAEILKGPFGGLDDDADLVPLASQRARGQSLWGQLRASDEPDHVRVRRFLEGVLQRRGSPPFEFLSAVLETSSDGDLPSGWELMLSRFGGQAREPLSALLDRAAAFDSEGPCHLELFLSAIESDGGELKRELSDAQDEIRVMTVHGAKGLEAPVVIAPDTVSGPRASGEGVFRAPSGAPVWALAKAKDCPITAKLRNEADDRALREHRRLLYVALTRARDRLVICGAAMGKAESSGRHEASWYVLCEQAMTRLEERQAGVERIASTDGDIRRFGPLAPRLDKRLSAPASSAAPDWLHRPAPPSASAPRIFTPSSLGGDTPPALAALGPERERRLLRGRLIHTLFEALPDLDQDLREAAAVGFLSRQPLLSEDERAEILASVMGVLTDPAFAAVFAPGGRAEAPIIGPFQGHIVNGRVDRLVRTENEALIVDFKTDRPAPLRVEDIGTGYKAQMAAYRAILGSLWPQLKIRCLLVWTDGPRLMEIPEADLESALPNALM